jgi:hypothetical protein
MFGDQNSVEEKFLFGAASDKGGGGGDFHRVQQILTNYSGLVNKKNAQIVKFVHFSGVY